MAFSLKKLSPAAMAVDKIREKGYNPLAMLSPAAMAMGLHKRKKQRDAMESMEPMAAMKRGGKVRKKPKKRKKIDGIAKKGKTKGRMV